MALCKAVDMRVGTDSESCRGCKQLGVAVAVGEVWLKLHASGRRDRRTAGAAKNLILNDAASGPSSNRRRGKKSSILK